MYTAKIENSGGEVLTLTWAESKWQVFDITGLDPPAAQINLTNLAGLDGARLNSTKLGTRNIVISIKINGDVEGNRLDLYRFFRTKEACTFYFTNGRRDVKIEGVVESVECPQFTNLEVMQVSIICPCPYFRALAEITADISNEIDGFSFPFSINVDNPVPFSIYVAHREADVFNDSDTETGAIIEVEFSGAVNKIMLANVGTGETLTVNYSFISGDIMTIDTNKGQKSLVLTRGGVKYNLFPALVSGSTFFQLRPGSNVFTYFADDGAADANVHITFTFSDLFAGV